MACGGSLFLTPLTPAECWRPDPHARPDFGCILQELEATERSALFQMPLESFHSLQQDWKAEIAGMFHDLRTKETVSLAAPPGQPPLGSSSLLPRAASGQHRQWAALACLGS